MIKLLLLFYLVLHSVNSQLCTDPGLTKLSVCTNNVCDDDSTKECIKNPTDDVTFCCVEEDEEENTSTGNAVITSATTIAASKSCPDGTIPPLPCENRICPLGDDYVCQLIESSIFCCPYHKPDFSFKPTTVSTTSVMTTTTIPSEKICKDGTTAGEACENGKCSTGDDYICELIGQRTFCCPYHETTAISTTTITVSFPPKLCKAGSSSPEACQNDVCPLGEEYVCEIVDGANRCCPYVPPDFEWKSTTISTSTRLISTITTSTPPKICKDGSTSPQVCENSKCSLGEDYVCELIEDNSHCCPYHEPDFHSKTSTTIFATTTLINTTSLGTKSTTLQTKKTDLQSTPIPTTTTMPLSTSQVISTTTRTTAETTSIKPTSTTEASSTTTIIPSTSTTRITTIIGTSPTTIFTTTSPTTPTSSITSSREKTLTTGTTTTTNIMSTIYSTTLTTTTVEIKTNTTAQPLTTSLPITFTIFSTTTDMIASTKTTTFPNTTRTITRSTQDSSTSTVLSTTEDATLTPTTAEEIPTTVTTITPTTSDKTTTHFVTSNTPSGSSTTTMSTVKLCTDGTKPRECNNNVCPYGFNIPCQQTAASSWCCNEIPSTTSSNTNCKDKVEGCQTKKHLCNNQYYQKLMHHMCAQTCDLCNAQDIPSISTKRWTSCSDTTTDCAKWKKDGYCENETIPLEQKKKECIASCSLCE